MYYALIVRKNIIVQETFVPISQSLMYSVYLYMIILIVKPCSALLLLLFIIIIIIMLCCCCGYRKRKRDLTMLQRSITHFWIIS